MSNSTGFCRRKATTCLNITKTGCCSEKTAAPALLFLTEGHTVGTLILGGVAFVRTYQDTLQRAVVGFIAVVNALVDSTLNTLVCIAVHVLFLLFSVMALV
jgi:hypothetical protein